MEPIETFIKKFIIKEKQDRYQIFLSKKKLRSKFTSELYHFKDLNWNYFREIKGNEIEKDVINERLISIQGITNCIVVSANQELDDKVMSVDEAIKFMIGKEATLLIFGNAEVVYYEGEGPGNRYISM